jgi:Flp pilus assembly protein TadG
MVRIENLKWLAVVSDEAGSTILEFSLSCMIVLVSILAILDFSRVMYIDHYLASAAREATRYAMVRGSTWSGTAGAACTTVTTFSCDANADDVKSFVTSTTPNGVNLANLTVTTTWPGLTAGGAPCAIKQGTNSPNCVVTVQLSYPFTFFTPFLLNTPLQLTSTSSVTISQ